MQHYTLDTSKLSVKECFRFGGWGFPVLLLAKLFGLSFSDGSVCASDLDELISIDGQTLELRSADPVLTELRFRCEQENLKFVFAYTIPPHPTKAMSLVYLSPTQKTIVELLHTVEEVAHTTVIAATPKRVGSGEFITGMYPRKKHLDPDPECEVVVLKPQTLDSFLKNHEERISKSEITRKFHTSEEVREYIIARNQRAVQYFVTRGLYVPLTDTLSK